MFRRVIKGTQIIYLWTRNLSMAKNKIKKTENKVGCWDIHKGLRDNQELRQS